MHIVTQGLVLREVSYKESDKILTVLTRDGGKRTVKARGCRKKNSPLAAAAQLSSGELWMRSGARVPIPRGREPAVRAAFRAFLEG